jgi:hypothetical protein
MSDSGYLIESAERAERHRFLREELDRYQSEFGAFTDDEMAEARALPHGAEEIERAASASSRTNPRSIMELTCRSWS